eukprot:SAG11_NODE_16651_length_541_cov_1.119910_1_plen_69_part_00
MAQLHLSVAKHDYQGKVGKSLDTSPEWKSEKKRLNGVKEAVVSALSLKTHALMDRLSTQAIGASDVDW